MDDNGRDDTTLLSLSLAVRGFAAILTSSHTMYKQNTNLTYPSVSVSIRRSAPSQTPMIISRGGADLPHHQVEPRNNHTDASTQGKGQNHKTQRCYTAFISYSRSPPSPSHQPPVPFPLPYVHHHQHRWFLYTRKKKQAGLSPPPLSFNDTHHTHPPFNKKKQVTWYHKATGSQRRRAETTRLTQARPVIHPTSSPSSSSSSISSSQV